MRTARVTRSDTRVALAGANRRAVDLQFVHVMTSEPTPRPSEPEDQRATPPPLQDGHPDPAGDGTPGDLDAPDIVSPTGEEMPVQHHDEVDGTR